MNRLDSALIAAEKSCSVDRSRSALAAGPNPDAADAEGFTALARAMSPLDSSLISAAADADIDQIRRALDRGADPLAADGLGRTALMSAIAGRGQRGRPDAKLRCVELLASVSDRRAVNPIAIYDNIPTLFAMAIDWGFFNGDASALIQTLRAAECSEPRGARATTGLIKAAAFGSQEALLLALPFSDIEARDPHGRTALMRAARHLDPACYRTLLELADIAAMDDSGLAVIDHLRANALRPASALPDLQARLAARDEQRRLLFETSSATPPDAAPCGPPRARL